MLDARRTDRLIVTVFSLDSTMEWLLDADSVRRRVALTRVFVDDRLFVCVVVSDSVIVSTV